MDSSRPAIRLENITLCAIDDDAAATAEMTGDSVVSTPDWWIRPLASSPASSSTEHSATQTKPNEARNGNMRGIDTIDGELRLVGGSSPSVCLPRVR
jgi:hypothetical protein